MNGTAVVTLQPRGQITIPKEYRDYLGIGGGTLLKTRLAEGRVIIEPLEKQEDPNVIKPTLSREEYLKTMREISAHIKKYGPLWTKEDDKARAESLRKEKAKWKKLNW